MSKSDASRAWDHAAFMTHLAQLRDQAGIGTWSEVAERVRLRGNLPTFNSSNISKWGPRAQPTIESLREIAHVLGVMPIELYLRAELVRPADLGQRPVPQMIQELIDLDREIEYYASRPTALAATFEDERLRLQDHIIGLVQLTRDKVRRLADSAGIKPPRSRRGPKVRDGE